MRAFRPLEAPIERRVVDRAWHELGLMGVKLQVVGQTGWPDRAFLLPGGRVLFIEFKRPGEEPTARQRYIHDLLRRLGFQVEVHDNENLAFAAIQQFATMKDKP